MNYKDIDRLELETGCKAIEFDGADGLYVFFDPDNKKSIVIVGEKGRTKINRAQALALANELKGIVEMYMEEK